MDILERVQLRATTIFKCLEHLIERVGEVGLFSLENRLKVILLLHRKIPEGRVQR